MVADPALGADRASTAGAVGGALPWFAMIAAQVVWGLRWSPYHLPSAPRCLEGQPWIRCSCVAFKWEPNRRRSGRECWAHCTETQKPTVILGAVCLLRCWFASSAPCILRNGRALPVRLCERHLLYLSYARLTIIHRSFLDDEIPLSGH